MQEKVVDMLTSDSVSIITKDLESGGTHRRAYKNSPSGRLSISANEPDEIVSEVLVVWGEAPTVTDFRPDFGNENRPSADTPTVAERIETLEEELEAAKILLGVE